MSRWAITVTYEDVQSLIFERCWHFKGIYGGQFEEWLSDANAIFMEAYYDFDSSLGSSFSYYLRYLLDRRLMDSVRNRARYNQRYHGGPKEDSSAKKEQGVNREIHTMERLVTEVSQDAGYILSLILYTPTDIKMAMFEPRKQQTDASKFKECLREFLEDMGWSVPRINQSLKEIKESL